MPKLTDAQLVILSAAARREDGAALPVPKSTKLKGAALTNTLEGLCKKGLPEERPAPPEAQAWREAEDGRRMTLVIAGAGLEAINAAPAEESRKVPAQGKARAKKPQSTRKTTTAKAADEKPAPADEAESPRCSVRNSVMKGRIIVPARLTSSTLQINQTSRGRPENAER